MVGRPPGGQLTSHLQSEKDLSSAGMYIQYRNDSRACGAVAVAAGEVDVAATHQDLAAVAGVERWRRRRRVHVVRAADRCAEARIGCATGVHVEAQCGPTACMDPLTRRGDLAAPSSSFTNAAFIIFNAEFVLCNIKHALLRQTADLQRGSLCSIGPRIQSPYPV